MIALAEALEREETKPWNEIDELIFRLYGLDEHDVCVVIDTVEVCGPYQSVRQRAEDPVPPDEMRVFCQYLQDMLQPLFEITGQEVAVKVAQQEVRHWLPSWQFVSVTMVGDELQGMQKLLARLMSEATKTASQPDHASGTRWRPRSGDPERTQVLDAQSGTTMLLAH